MDNALIFTVIGVPVNVVVGLTILAGFFWRIPTKDDLKRVEDKVDDNSKQLQSISGDVRGLQERVGNLELSFQKQEEFNKLIAAKTETSIDLHHKARGDFMVLQASILRLESYFETPKLKSS